MRVNFKDEGTSGRHLNCTPEMFPSKAEPITLDERKMSYPVNFKDLIVLFMR